VLGAIVIVAVRTFLKVGALRRYWRLDRPNLAIASTAIAAVLVFDLLPGLIIAVVLSLLLYIWYTSRPRVAQLGNLPGTQIYGDITEHPQALATPGIIVLRPDGQLFFGNIARVHTAVMQQLDTDPKPDVVVLDMSASYGLGLPSLDNHRRTTRTTGRPRRRTLVRPP